MTSATSRLFHFPYSSLCLSFFNAEIAEVKMSQKEELNQITEKIIGAAIVVHQTLGPGLLESTYEACLAYQLAKCGYYVERQKQLPLIFGGIRLDCAYRIDLLINKQIVVEVKAVEQVLPIHKAQLLSYLRLSRCKVGLLINFDVRLLNHGITRIVNKFPDESNKKSLRALR
jgi:GxxExxY protein